MKKSLIALAALAFVGAAAAQSSVTLYGVADIWVGKLGKGKVQAGVDGVAPSRIGFRGVEDLGGGLKANFNFEQYLDLSNGSTTTSVNNPTNTTTFGRQANVGFSSAYGTIKLGRSTTALDDIFGAANSGFDSALSASNVWLNGYPSRADAQLYYATPEMGGFSAAGSTQLKGNAPTGKVSTFNVKYAAGPIYAGVGYSDDAVGTKGTLFNASYDLGMAKLLGSVYTTKTAANLKTNSFQIGADVPLSSALTLSVGYANSNIKGDAFKADSAFSIAAAYSLSKRTLVYTGYKAESRKSGAADADLFAVGVNHSF